MTEQDPTLRTTVTAPGPPPFIFDEQVDPFHVVRCLLDEGNKGDPNLVELRGYRFVRELGRGGMGAVALIEHDQRRDKLALKVMLPRIAVDPKAKDKFVRELRNAEALDHENVVRLKASGSWGGIFYYTMEYCAFGSVSDLIEKRGGRLELTEARSLMLQTLEALQYTHHADVPHVKLSDGRIGKGRGLVHRDLKPPNILLSGSEQACIAKLGDYGLAKAFEFAGLSGMTVTGELGGSLACMPRQQLVNYKRAKPEVDVWAIAACFYFMLIGKYPRDFPARRCTLAELVQIIETTDPIPIRQRGVQIPDNLADLLDVALDDSRHLRFQSVASFKHELLSVLKQRD